MSSEDRLNEKPKRRRGFRRQTEETPVMNVDDEVDDEGMDDEDDESSGRGITVGKGRPTPSRRTSELEVVKQEGNIITRLFGSITGYWEGVNSERQKIVWPTREETRRLTWIVLVVTIVSAIVLGIITLLFNGVLDIGLKSPGLICGGLFVLALIGFVVYLRISNRRTSSF